MIALLCNRGMFTPFTADLAAAPTAGETVAVSRDGRAEEYVILELLGTTFTLHHGRQVQAVRMKARPLRCSECGVLLGSRVYVNSSTFACRVCPLTLPDYEPQRAAYEQQGVPDDDPVTQAILAEPRQTALADMQHQAAKQRRGAPTRGTDG